MAVQTLMIDGRRVGAREGGSILETAREAGIAIPALCHIEGLSAVASCRLCLVEIEGDSRLVPACVTRVEDGMAVRTDTERLRSHRRIIVEFLFAERNHVCAVCVADSACELQDAAVAVGMDHVGLAYSHPRCEVDLSHDLFGLDQSRCILCTRCVRVCGEIEGARTWGIAHRGTNARLVADGDTPWGDSPTCTSCGLCVLVCPTGALFHRGDTVAERRHDRLRIVAEIAERGEDR